MKLSKNFDLNEFTRSEKAYALGIHNFPPENIQKSLKTLCVKLLQPLRDAYGRSIHISSGYRCEQLNTAVGGVPTSQHRLGEAADLVIRESAGILLEVLEHSGLEFDQAILYRGKNMLHVSYREGKNRKHIIIKK